MITIDLSRCTGCKLCESACAFFHTGRINDHLSRIKVLNLYEIGVDGPLVCCQCEERACMPCPESALSIGPLGQVIVSPTVCGMCGACEQGCPIGAVDIFNDLVHVCDLCGGKPRCVEACTEGAIRFDPDAPRPSLESFQAETRGMSPAEKRRTYLGRLAADLRKDWRRSHA